MYSFKIFLVQKTGVIINNILNIMYINGLTLYLTHQIPIITVKENKKYKLKKTER